MTQLIGFIGLGIMGLPMAKNLLKSGYSVIGYNRSEHNLKELVNMGGSAAKNPKEVAEKTQIIITCLPNSKSVLDVVFQKEGLIEGFQPGSILIDCSTISPKVTTEISKKHSKYKQYENPQRTQQIWTYISTIKKKQNKKQTNENHKTMKTEKFENSGKCEKYEKSENSKNLKNTKNL